MRAAQNESCAAGYALETREASFALKDERLTRLKAAA